MTERIDEFEDQIGSLEGTMASAGDMARALRDGLEETGRALKATGIADEDAAEAVDDVRRRDERRLNQQVQQTSEVGGDTLAALKKIKPEPI